MTTSGAGRMTLRNDGNGARPDPGRREFLARAVAGIGAAGALTAGFGFLNQAYAARKTPTTIIVQSEVFPALGVAWSRYHRGGMANDYYGYPTQKAVAHCTMRIGHCSLPVQKIDMKATIILPDYHFLRIKMGHIIGSRYLNEKIKPPNPALYSFIEGLRAYWKGAGYRPPRKHLFARAEEHFSNGIFYAAGLTQEDTRGTGLSYDPGLSPEGNAELLAKQFRETTPYTDRLPAMQKLVEKSNAMSKTANRRNLSPDEPYYQMLAANWCALMLVWTMQWDRKRENEYISINRNLEIPLRKGIGYKIRDEALGS